MELHSLNLYLKIFQFAEIPEVMAFVRKYQLYNPDDKFVNFTGAGSNIYKKEISEGLTEEIRMNKISEFIVYSKGLHSYIDHYPQGVYKMNQEGLREYNTEDHKVEEGQPRYLIMGGSGVIFYQVFKDGQFKIYGNTLIAGPTIIALISFITGITDYNQMVELAKKGNRKKIDLHMSDLTVG